MKSHVHEAHQNATQVFVLWVCTFFGSSPMSEIIVGRLIALLLTCFSCFEWPKAFYGKLGMGL